MGVFEVEPDFLLIAKYIVIFVSFVLGLVCLQIGWSEMGKGGDKKLLKIVSPISLIFLSIGGFLLWL